MLHGLVHAILIFNYNMASSTQFHRFSLAESGRRAPSPETKAQRDGSTQVTQAATESRIAASAGDTSSALPGEHEAEPLPSLAKRCRPCPHAVPHAADSARAHDAQSARPPGGWTMRDVVNKLDLEIEAQ